MNFSCRKTDSPFRKNLIPCRVASRFYLRSSGKKRANQRYRIPGKIRNRPFRNDLPAVRSGLRPHFDQPVCLRQNLRVVIHQENRISIRRQILHDPDKTQDIGGMQTDGRLVQHIQNARGAVPHRPGQLHSLTLSGRKRGGRPVQGQVSKPQLHQPLCHGLEGFTDTLRHGTHFLRQRSRHAVHPLHQLSQSHPAGLVQRNPPESGLPGGL